MPRAIILQTQNEHKLNEYKDIFGRVGIDVIQDASCYGEIGADTDSYLERIQRLLTESSEGRSIIAVLKEQSNIYADSAGAVVASPDRDLQPVWNITQLEVWSLDPANGQVTKDHYQASASVPGHLDLSRRSTDTQVFGWDDLFVARGSQLTYLEMRAIDLKCSARDLVLATWLTDKVPEAERPSPTPAKQGRLSRSFFDQLKKNPYLADSESQHPWLEGMVQAALKKGALAYNFEQTGDDFSMAKTIVKDLIENLVESPVFDGSTDVVSRRVHVLHAVIKKAVADVVVEMFFTENPEFPSLKTLDIDSADPEAVKKVLRAHIRLATRGDASEWEKLGLDEEDLSRLQEKIRAGAIRVYEEASATFDLMAKKASQIKKWRPSAILLEDEATPTFRNYLQKLQSKTGTKLEDLDFDALAGLIFNEIFETSLGKIWTRKKVVEVDEEEASEQSLLRFMKSQTYIFDEFDFIPESAIYRKKILGFLNRNRECFTEEKIERICGFFHQFIDVLFERKLIDEKELIQFKEAYPMVSPPRLVNIPSLDGQKDLGTYSSLVLRRSANHIGSKSILGLYTVKGVPFHLASDLHWNLNGKYGLTSDEAIQDLANRIIYEQKANTLFLLGDIFEGEEPDRSPKDTSWAINRLLTMIAPHFKTIIFVPGNHDLRRVPLKANPWSDFILPPNVVMPYGTDPVIATLGSVRALIGNLGYDMNFIDPGLVGLTREEIIDFYATTTDGKGLLEGKKSINIFEEMSRSLAKKITPDIDLVATHVAPHPCVIKFKTDKPVTDIALRRAGLNFDFNPLEDERLAKKNKNTPDGFRKYWNYKSFFMGSDILKPSSGARPRPGLTLLYGHNHRGSEMLNEVYSTPIRLITHQQSQWLIMR